MPLLSFMSLFSDATALRRFSIATSAISMPLISRRASRRHATTDGWLMIHYAEYAAG